MPSKSGRLSGRGPVVYCLPHRPTPAHRCGASALMFAQTTPIEEIRAAQLARVRALLAAVLPGNPFYTKKLAGFSPDNVRSLEDFSKLPFTTKAELVTDQAANPPYGTNLTFPLERYTRLHQTSGTSTGQ